MVRGRHRGLPLAIDRSILLPQDLIIQEQPQTQAMTTETRAQSEEKDE